MDGMRHDEFLDLFGDVVLISINTDSLRRNLRPNSRRPDAPNSEEYVAKSSELVAYLESGGKVSPPILTKEKDGIHIAGGNHRIGWAMHVGQPCIPALVRKSDLNYFLINF